jgi:hypothetical protein
VLSERLGLDGPALVRASRLTAKVDSAAVQDGFQIYLHGFIVADDGKWVVVQQGMKPEAKAARRYHWHSEAVSDFVDAPHAGIEGENQGTIVNLTDHAAAASRAAQVEVLKTEGPDRIVAELKPQLSLPFHHEVRADDVVLRRLHGALAAAADAGPKDFAELLLVPGIGARTVFSLAQVAEVVHGAPFRFSDPARFSLAHGGKDGHPFPVPLKVYDRTIGVMRDAIAKAKLGNTERTEALRRLALQAQLCERTATGPPLEQLIADERRVSHTYAGRTVDGWAEPHEEIVHPPTASRVS